MTALRATRNVHCALQPLQRNVRDCASALQGMFVTALRATRNVRDCATALQGMFVTALRATRNVRDCATCATRNVRDCATRYKECS